MKLAQLKAFLAVADTGRFSLAGEQLNVSQAAVSYAVAELERHLGTRLLERGHFGARLTPLGEAVAAHARGMTQLEDAVYQEVSLSRGVVAGELRVVSFRSAAGKIVAPLMSHLRSSYPDLKVHLSELDNEGGVYKMRLVRERRADIAFVDGNTSDNDLINWEVMRDPYVTLLRTGDPRDTVSWDEITTDNLILSTGHNSGSRVRQHFASLGREVEPAYQVGEDSTIFGMVAAGLGVGLMPAFAADALPEGVKCVPTDVTLERPVYVSILPASLKIPAVRAFLGALREAYPESEIPVLGVNI